MNGIIQLLYRACLSMYFYFKRDLTLSCEDLGAVDLLSSPLHLICFSITEIVRNFTRQRDGDVLRSSLAS